MPTATTTMIRVDFDETVPVRIAEVYGYLRSPEEWPRLYGAFGEVRDLGDGWFVVPLPGERPDIEARITSSLENEHAEWDLRGTFAGRGAVHLEAVGDGTRITGFEEIDVTAFAGDADALAVVDRGFRAIWQHGWDRLREGATDTTT